MDAGEHYEKICKDKFDALKVGQDELKTIAQKTHKALCESNGKPSVLSRLEKLEATPVPTKEISIGGGMLKMRGFNPKEVGRIVVWIIIVYLFLSEIGVAPKGFVKDLLENKDAVAEVIHSIEDDNTSSGNSL